MGEAYFDSKPIGLWNFREIEGDCKGCTVRLVKRRALLTSFWPVHHKSFNFIVQCFIIMWMISKKFEVIVFKGRFTRKPSNLKSSPSLRRHFPRPWELP